VHSGSTTSTDIYNQDSYENFAPKVINLLHNIDVDANPQPSNYHSAVSPMHSHVEVYRMAGGAYNRIIGANLPDGTACVVRIPRLSENQDVPEVADQAALLCYVAKSLPVPPVLKYDTSYLNSIGSAYMIQGLVPGVPLEDVYANMSATEKAQVVTEVIGVMKKMDDMTFPGMGLLKASPAAPGVRLAPWKPDKDDGVYIPPTTISGFLSQRFKSHGAECLRRDPTPGQDAIFTRGLAPLADRLTQKRDSNPRIRLYHNDFEPRNILVNRNSEGAYVVTAVLDFDCACAAPAEVAQVLPHWLWTWNAAERDGDACLANETPKDPQALALKQQFDVEIEQVFPGFWEFWRTNTALRELLRFAIEGIDSNEGFARAEKFITDHRETGVPLLNPIFLVEDLR
jgi:aminoglycoside phosphotransferase (APT) family kinase protein